MINKYLRIYKKSRVRGRPVSAIKANVVDLLKNNQLKHIAVNS